MVIISIIPKILQSGKVPQIISNLHKHKKWKNSWTESKIATFLIHDIDTTGLHGTSSKYLYAIMYITNKLTIWQRKKNQFNIFRGTDATIPFNDGLNLWMEILSAVYK